MMVREGADSGSDLPVREVPLLLLGDWFAMRRKNAPLPGRRKAKAIVRDEVPCIKQSPAEDKTMYSIHK